MNFRFDVRRLTRAAFFAAVCCVVSPFSVPLGFTPVPLSLATLVIYLLGCRLSVWESVGGVLVYLLLGAAGLPVFSGMRGGAAALFGPTGGYLVGYLVLAAACALSAGRKTRVKLAGMLAGTAGLYLLGTAWYCVACGATFAAALSLCVLPYLPGDALKILAALLIDRRMPRG